MATNRLERSFNFPAVNRNLQMEISEAITSLQTRYSETKSKVNFLSEFFRLLYFIVLLLCCYYFDSFTVHHVNFVADVTWSLGLIYIFPGSTFVMRN